MVYWVYMLKLQGHVFVATLGSIAVMLMLWFFRVQPWHFSFRVITMIITCPLGYPLFGIYGLAAVLLMGIWSWRLERWSLRRKVGYIVMALLIAIVVPLMCYRQLYHQTNLANIYYAGLPLYYVTEEHHAYYIPYYLLALFFVVMALVPLRQVKLLKSILIQGVVLVALVVGVALSWFRDENYHHELRMQRCIEQNDWNGVLKEAARQQDEPTRAIVMMRNLALSRLGRQGEDMYTYENG
jgi:MFS family permease